METYVPVALVGDQKRRNPLLKKQLRYLKDEVMAALWSKPECDPFLKPVNKKLYPVCTHGFC
jgi:hypothetical protein